MPKITLADTKRFLQHQCELMFPTLKTQEKIKQGYYNSFEIDANKEIMSLISHIKAVYGKVFSMIEAAQPGAITYSNYVKEVSSFTNLGTQQQISIDRHQCKKIFITLERVLMSIYFDYPESNENYIDSLAEVLHKEYAAWAETHQAWERTYIITYTQGDRVFLSSYGLMMAGLAGGYATNQSLAVSSLLGLAGYGVGYFGAKAFNYLTEPTKLSEKKQIQSQLNAEENRTEIPPVINKIIADYAVDCVLPEESKAVSPKK